MNQWNAQNSDDCGQVKQEKKHNILLQLWHLHEKHWTKTWEKEGRIYKKMVYKVRKTNKQKA